MRTVDLITELQTVAKEAERAALIVGFENSTVFVFSNDPNAINTLNQTCHAGGQPVGILRWFREGETLSLHAGPLQEFADDDDIRNYISNLMATFTSLIQEKIDGNASEEGEH